MKKAFNHPTVTTGSTVQQSNRFKQSKAGKIRIQGTMKRNPPEQVGRHLVAREVSNPWCIYRRLSPCIRGHCGRGAALRFGGGRGRSETRPQWLHPMSPNGPSHHEPLRVPHEIRPIGRDLMLRAALPSARSCSCSCSHSHPLDFLPLPDQGEGFKA